MMKRAASFCLLSILLTGSNVFAVENVIYNNFAVCSADIDGVPTRLDYFEELAANDEKPTGKGFVMQTLGAKDGLQMLLQTTVQKDNNIRKVDMYSALNPLTLFAKIEFPTDQSTFMVDIFAINFSAKWATVSCVSK